MFPLKQIEQRDLIEYLFAGNISLQFQHPSRKACYSQCRKVAQQEIIKKMFQVN